MRWKPIEFEKGDYLRSLTAKEALAGFLVERGECFWELGNTVEALKSYHYARQLAPDNERYKWLHGKRSREYLKLEEADRAIEEQVRKSYEQQFIPGEHSPLCKCAKCQEPKVQRWQRNSHSPNCQCAECRKAREAAMQPMGMAGHLAFGLPDQQPRHAIPSQTVPGLPGF